MNKILMIEDDETIRLGLKYYFEQEEFEVLESKNCKETLTLLEEKNSPC